MSKGKKRMKRMLKPAIIERITEEEIFFSNGSTISYDHCADCCEWNYADFSQLEELAKKTVFTFPLTFEKVEGAGFRFGNPVQKMFFVPCYSEQNGYYSDEIEIYFNGEEVLNFCCEMVEY